MQKRVIIEGAANWKTVFDLLVMDKIVIYFFISHNRFCGNILISTLPSTSIHDESIRERKRDKRRSGIFSWLFLSITKDLNWGDVDVVGFKRGKMICKGFFFE